MVNHLLALIALVAGAFFATHENADPYMKVTAWGIFGIALLYMSSSVSSAVLVRSRKQLPWVPCRKEMPGASFDKNGHVNSVVGYLKPECLVEGGVPFITADVVWFRQNGPQNCSHWAYINEPGK